MNIENKVKTDMIPTTHVDQNKKIEQVKDDTIDECTHIIKKDTGNEQDPKTEDNADTLSNLQNINESITMIKNEEICLLKYVEVPKELPSEYKHAVVEEIKGMEYVSSIQEPTQCIQTKEDVDQIIKQMESQLINSNMLSEETESDTDDSPKPFVTTPSMSRRGLGGSQRLPQGERPTVQIVTDFAEDSSEEEEEETPYFVTEPVEKPKRRNVKFRFDSGDYRDDEESDREGEEKVKAARVEKKFERMASETKELDLEKSDGEFQKMVSQFSVEEMDEALNLWDKGGLTPSDLDSKSLTEPSDETSPQGFDYIFKTNLSTILPTTFFGGGPLMFGITENRKFSSLDTADENVVDHKFISSKSGNDSNYSSNNNVYEKGEKIKSELEEKQITDSHQRGGRPPLKYDISVDEEPEFDPTEHDWRFNLHTHLEHDEDHSDGSDGYSMDPKGPSQQEVKKK